MAEVRRKLAQADEEDARHGLTPHQVSGSIFIRTGLEIEEQMYAPLLAFPPTTHPSFYRRQLSFVIKTKPAKSNTQRASLQEKRNSLANQIKRWRELQLLYMPGIVIPSPPTRDDTDENQNDDIEDMILILPSALESSQRLTICKYRVAEYEQQFRLAQLEDSLVELRRVRRIRRTLVTNHRIQVAGQGRRANTRSRSVIDNIQERITKFAHRYRAAYEALGHLDSSGSWRETYLELKECDNRGPGKEPEEDGVGDGSYAPSWIWLSNPRGRDPSGATDPNEDASEEEVNDTMRVEWTMSFARAERWTEEIQLLQEEMRRVLAFLEWKSSDWLSKREARSAWVTPDIRSGLDAYARKQADICRNLAVSFATLWHPTLVSYGLNSSWAETFLQRSGVSLTSTSTSRNPGILEHRTVSSAKYDQPDTPSTSHISPAPHSINEDMLLDQADFDSSTDGTSSDACGFESESDDDDDDDDDGYDFELDE